jgi:hypothetical protein
MFFRLVQTRRRKPVESNGDRGEVVVVVVVV